METSTNIVTRIINVYFGGHLGSFADWCARPQQTVSSWKANNSIPAGDQREILAKSDAENRGIEAWEFFPSRVDEGCRAETGTVTP